MLRARAAPPAAACVLGSIASLQRSCVSTPVSAMPFRLANLQARVSGRRNMFKSLFTSFK